MIKSFFDTSTRSDLFLYVDSDDKYLDEYVTLFAEYKDYPFTYFIGARMSITRIFNGAYCNFPDYTYYHLSNDDFVYKTENWDQIFIDKIQQQGHGICHCNDGYMKEDLPVAPFISGVIVRRLGWLQMPKLEHLFGDCVWKVIGDNLKCRYYIEDVMIEHHHPFNQNQEVEKDSVFERTNSTEMYSKDQVAYRDWLKNRSYDDCERVRNAVSKG